MYGNPQSSIGTPFSTYDINVPQLYAQVDRTRAKQMGINLTDIYDTMQVNLGSLYVNDFTKFGKTYQVVVQADAPFRSDAAAITNLKTRNAAGEMVPLGALMKVEPRISQITYLPTWVLSQSIPLDNFNRACMVSPIKRLCLQRAVRGS